ncbi:MAG: hypothetical protein ACP5U2_01615 [Bryobacteraceae bacterium]
MQDAGLLQRASGKPREYQRLLGAHVFQHAQNLDPKLFDAIAGKNSLAHAFHPGLHALQGKVEGLGLQRRGCQTCQDDPHPHHAFIL